MYRYVLTNPQTGDYAFVDCALRPTLIPLMEEHFSTVVEQCHPGLDLHKYEIHELDPNDPYRFPRIKSAVERRTQK